MEEHWQDIGRRDFLKRFSLGLTGVSLGALSTINCATGLKSTPKLKIQPYEESPAAKLSLVTGTDRRQMIYNTLKSIMPTSQASLA